MKRRSKRNVVAMRLLIAIAIIAVIVGLLSRGENDVFAKVVSLGELMTFDDKDDTPSYARMTLENDPKSDPTLPSIVMEAIAYDDSSSDAKLSQEGDSLHWNNEKGWVEWTFEVGKSGWYELHMDFMPLKGSNASAIRGILIDEQYQFSEAERIEFERQFKDSKYPYDRNEIGQQIRPPQQEITDWINKALTHYAASSEPLLFQLEQGKHTLRLVGSREPLAIKSLSFEAGHVVPSYETYVGQHPAEVTQEEWYQIIEAEEMDRKSSIAIQTDTWSEPYISPDPEGRITYNVLGGWRWRLPGEWVEWDFTVPADGWYEIDVKAFQDYRNGFEAYRAISIDGEVPFQEMLTYGIPNKKEFFIHELANDQDEAYKFYLQAGDHRLRLTSDSTALQPVYLALRNTLSALADYDRTLRQLTGTYGLKGFDANIDSTRTWEMRKLDPDVKERMNGFVNRLTEIRMYMDGMNGKDSDLSQSIRSSVGILEDMLKDVDEIPVKIDDFTTIQNNIGTWMSTLTHQPLMLDYIVVRTAGTETGLKAVTLASRIPYSIKDFARSFYLDYDTRKHNKKEALTVWVQRGRDYAEQLRELVDQDFTPRTGIQVNINLMPNPNMLILGNASGDVPDVALGIAEATPVDFAMRGAAYDLSQYADFEEVFDRFVPGVARSLQYDGGAYGLPEVQNFQVLYYRSDILEGLGLEVPDTWEDMFDILPTLQENGMTFSYPKSDFSTIFFQHGAEIYDEDGMESALTSVEGQKAFKTWTELFTKYNLPIDIPAFFQHFREGNIPLGIADFNTYVQLLVAAPEITGHWGIAPLPGIVGENGEVERWSPQSMSAGMIMEKSDRKDEAWQFLKWWTSADVQSQYAEDMESFYGMEFRWNTANVEAMKSLVWPAEDLEALEEQRRWAKNMPYVPGYYFLAREMEFAWNKRVLEAMPMQEVLEGAQLSLQREMRRRQLDFGLDPSYNLHVPQIKEPFEWKENNS
ncbi:extracellular solute-binding protein [Paenibacillus sp. FA6]|uniref:extracellular solute-binding protein n=1 Tax=Paenibacillus sp. FA6 TaxID=3413029 RepID=UPI003F657E62